MADPYAGIAKIVLDDPYAGIANVVTRGPDWTQHPTWDAALQEIRKLPATEQQAAMKDWASQTVSRERSEGGIGTRVDDFVRRLARGLPVGSWADEGNAAIASTLGIADYDQQLAYERAKDTQGDADATKVGELPLIGDVTTAGLTKLAGGILSAPVTPTVRAFQGASLLPRMGNAAATGAAAGTVYGAGEGETTGDRAQNAAIGAGVGTALGAVAPAAGRGLGNAVDYLSNAFRGKPQELAGISNAAVRRLGRAAADDDLVARYPAQSAELGREGMLMDMGSNLRGQASAIANQPGAGQRVIRDALEMRSDGARNRIENSINNAFGPDQNLIQLERNTLQAANAQAAPHYADFYSRQVDLTPQLDDILSRIPPNIIRDAENLARIDGHQLWVDVPRQGLPPITQPSPRGWDYFKRAIQDEIDKVTPNSEAGGALTRLDQGLRATVDAAVEPGNPAAGPWAQARAAAGTGKQFQQGLRDGSGVFSRPKTHSPDEVADDLANATPTYDTGYRAGARGDLASMMNDAGSQFGPSGDKAARKGLWSANAENKVNQLARSPRSAGIVLRRRNAESTFGETQNAVTANSATSARLQAQKEFPNAAENSGSGRRATDTTMFGLAAEGGRKALNAMTLGAHNERLAAMADNAARVLSATGMQRDVYFRGLEKYLAGNGASAAQAQRVAQAVEALLISGVPSATGAATAPAKR